MEDHLAKDVVLLTIPHLATLYDYIIIAAATSKPHLDALERYCRRELKSLNFTLSKPTEGRNSGHWRIVDGGFMVIHLMDDEARNRYRLENLWEESKKIPFSLRTKRKKRVCSKK